MIVEALELREQRAKHERARGDDAMRGAFDRLTKAEAMGETVDSGNTLRQNDAMRQRPALEALLHAAMFEEKLGMQVQNMFADIEEDQFDQLYDVGAHRTERQSLNIGTVHHRDATLSGFERHRRVERIGAVERRHDRACPIMKDKTIRLGMAGEFQSEQIGDLALVPAQEGADAGDAWERTARDTAQDEEILVHATARDITKFEVAVDQAAIHKPSASGRRS